MGTKIFNKRQITFTPRSITDISEVENLLQSLGVEFEQKEIDEGSLSDFHKLKIDKGIEDIEDGKFLSNTEVARKVRSYLK